MPTRGRPRRNPLPEATPEEQARHEESLREQAPPLEPELEGPETEQTVTDSGSQEGQELQEFSAGEPGQDAPTVEQSVTDGTHQENALAADEPRQQDSPDTLLGYMAENFRDDIRAFMQNFGINGHPPESVFDAINGIAEKFRGEQSAAEAHAGQPEQVPAPVQHQAEPLAEVPIPLNVKIDSLQMDGDTRAFATAKYGDLTIDRIRVKQDGYGTLSVAMPKYRQPGGWSETCYFDTVESRNRLTGAVLDAYGQTLAQIQGQAQPHTESLNPGEVQTPAQDAGSEEAPDFEESGQGGPVMGMSQW